MGHYLKAAFWAPLRTKLFGDLPVNVLMVAGFFIVGLGEVIRFGHAGFWLLGLGLEVVFLFSLATNRRFQKWADALNREQTQEKAEHKRQELISKLHADNRRRLYTLEEKIHQTHDTYNENQFDSIITGGNHHALQKLSWMYLRLLLGEQNLANAVGREIEQQVQKQIHTLKAEIGEADLSKQAKESKSATLSILQKRLENFERRHTLLKETRSNLARIEAQVELALENARMRITPQVISDNIGLVSALLEDDYYSDMESDLTSLNKELN